MSQNCGIADGEMYREEDHDPSSETMFLYAAAERRVEQTVGKRNMNARPGVYHTQCYIKLVGASCRDTETCCSLFKTLRYRRPYGFEPVYDVLLSVADFTRR